MNIDELARDVARRTSGAVASTTDLAEGYQDLLQMRRRRTRTVVALATAAALGVVAVVWAGVAGPSTRHTAPAVPVPRPTPSVTKLYLAAPPLCGADYWTKLIAQDGLGNDVRSAANVGGGCPAGPVPGRYLSAFLSVGSPEPFAFTLPADWKVSGVPSDNTDDPMPAGGGILVRSVRTGDGFAITVYPVERDAAGPQGTDLGLTPRQIATWAAAQHSSSASRVTRTSVDGRTAWQVDFTLPEGASALTPCIVGGVCAALFDVRTHATHGPGAFGTLPGGESRALIFTTTSGAPVLVWVWGHAGSDDIHDPNSQIRAVVDSIDLSPRLS